MSGILRSLGYATTPLQTPWVAEKLKYDKAIAPQEVLLLTADGRIFGGVDAYLFIARQIWWARPIAWLARLRPIDRLLRFTYRWIAAHRRQISAACRLQPDLPIEEGGGV